MSDVALFWAGESGTSYFRLLWPAELLGVEARDGNELFGCTAENTRHIILHNPIHIPVYVHAMKLHLDGVRITVGIDDDFTSLPANSPAFVNYHPANNNTRADFNVLGEMVKISDSLVVTTEALANRYGKAHKNLHIIPNYLPDFYYDREPVNQWGVGWAANIDGHRGDAEVIHGALRDFPLRVVGRPPSLPESRYEEALGSKLAQILEWRNIKGPYQEAVESFAIGIVPLKDTAFNRAKSPLKGLEYSALGVPFVASPVGEYLGFPAGLRARKPKDWVKQVHKLATDQDFWLNQAEHNAKVADWFRLSKNIHQWESAWDL